MKSKIILSLFDASGEWSKPYRKAGYTVLQRDISNGDDILTDTHREVSYMLEDGYKFHGIMAAVPCTEFACSGARWWKEKETQAPVPHKKLVTGLQLRIVEDCANKLEYAQLLAIHTLFLIEIAQPAWWVIENPRGRLPGIVPEVGPCKLVFNPCDFGDPYTKETRLYGNFNPDLVKTPVLPLEGSRIHKLSSSAKYERSLTPAGFAQAFYDANP